MLIVLPLLLTQFQEVRCSCEELFESRPGEKQGQFRSPGYPNSYPENVHCRYVFQGTRDERIKISFSEFDLENGTNAGCLFDYVDVFTIDVDNTKQLEDRLCGRTRPSPFIAVHQRVELVFKSDWAGAHRGFLGAYEFIDERWQPFAPNAPECGESFRSGVGGELTSPCYPGVYPAHIECTWMIKVDYETKIILNIVELNFEPTIPCSSTYVAIYNGFASPRVQPQQILCGSTTLVQRNFRDRERVNEFKSTSFRIVIRFVSGSMVPHGHAGAFRIIWTAVHLPKEFKSASGNYEDEPCSQFHCKGGEYCIDTSGLLCNRLPRYCIAAELRCNGVPNCGVVDHSDEEGCLTTIVTLSTVTLLAVLTGAVSGVTLWLCCKRRRLAQLEAEQLHKDQALEALNCASTSLDEEFADDYDDGHLMTSAALALKRFEGSPIVERRHSYLPPTSMASHHHTSNEINPGQPSCIPNRITYEQYLEKIGRTEHPKDSQHTHQFIEHQSLPQFQPDCYKIINGNNSHYHGNSVNGSTALPCPYQRRLTPDSARNVRQLAPPLRLAESIQADIKDVHQTVTTGGQGHTPLGVFRSGRRRSRDGGSHNSRRRYSYTNGWRRPSECAGGEEMERIARAEDKKNPVTGVTETNGKPNAPRPPKRSTPSGERLQGSPSWTQTLPGLISIGGTEWNETPRSSHTRPAAAANHWFDGPLHTGSSCKEDVRIHKMTETRQGPDSTDSSWKAADTQNIAGTGRSSAEDRPVVIVAHEQQYRQSTDGRLRSRDRNESKAATLPVEGLQYVNIKAHQRQHNASPVPQLRTFSTHERKHNFY